MINLSDNDLKEIFSLFTCVTTYELEQIYDKNNIIHFYELINLSEEYELTSDKRDYALDALRAVLFFLLKHGYEIKKGHEIINIENVIEKLFVKE